VRRGISSTYRIQINTSFDLNAAVSIVPYLRQLGIDSLYCSPYLQAAPGSTHGYDVVDHSRINREWGGASAHTALCDELRRHGMGHVIDVVPNHMAVGGRNNPWWWDLLENGPASAYASFFDVDWDPPERGIRNVVLLPLLEDHYGLVMDRGLIRLMREGNEILVTYRDHRFPVAPRSIARILDAMSSRFRNDELSFIGDALAALALPTATDLEVIERRHRDRRVLLARLSAMLESNEEAVKALDATLADLNTDREALHQFLQRQNYRLAYWRVATHDLSYRRFFDINSLIGLRMENPRAFAATHSMILGWVNDGMVDGLRVDHPDGLRLPSRYLHRLREACPRAWLVVEKILARGENLREGWPVDGTTGYDFLNISGGVFINRDAEQSLTDLYQSFTGEKTDFRTIAREKKIQVLRESLGGEVNRLVANFQEICETDRYYRDYTRHDLQEAIRTTLACFEQYRTYVADSGADAQDEASIAAAVESAGQWRPDIDSRLLDLFADILCLRRRDDMSRELAMRFQQLCAAVTAKGVEDTAFYVFNRFIALNEVGGSPDHFGTSVDEFHRWALQIARGWPATMLASSTHDNKRSEDVRARLAVLSEIPEKWRHRTDRWRACNDEFRSGEFPDRNIEYHLYQTIVGSWPIDESRLIDYARKAAREAKTYTSWNSPNKGYEAALEKFLRAIMHSPQFIESVGGFVAEITPYGYINGLAATLLKLTAPGVPDFYQGSELWHFALVDPDNRRPVDFDVRRRALAEIEKASPDCVMARIEEGLPKLWLIRRALRLRAKHPEWFGPDAAYTAMFASGERAEHIVAFMRGSTVIAVVPRLSAIVDGQWGSTSFELPAGSWRSNLDDCHWRGSAKIRINDLFRQFPVALLSREDAGA